MSRSQVAILAEVLADGKPHSAFELARIVAEENFGGAENVHHGLRIGARIWDLRNKRGMNIHGWNDPENPQKHIYQLVRPVEAQGAFFERPQEVAR